MTIIIYLANSFGIKAEENKVELINLLVQKINQVEDKEYKEFSLLIDKYINTHKIGEKKNQKANKTIKKRNYNEPLKSIDEANKKEIIKEEQEILSKYFTKKVKYETLVGIGNKYYYMDDKGNDLEFREKNGSATHYYFVCSTSKYKAFGKILRTDQNKEFILTKSHNIPY